MQCKAVKSERRGYEASAICERPECDGTNPFNYPRLVHRSWRGSVSPAMTQNAAKVKRRLIIWIDSNCTYFGHDIEIDKQAAREIVPVPMC
jgi:hypothetical protein